MKKIKLSKTQILPVVVILLAIVGSAVLINLNQQIRALTDRDISQQKEIDKAKVDLKSLNASNGSSLEKCLDDAAKVYNNSLKATGKATPQPNGSTEYTHDLQTWNAINDTLNKAREKCTTQYK